MKGGEGKVETIKQNSHLRIQLRSSKVLKCTPLFWTFFPMCAVCDDTTASLGCFVFLAGVFRVSEPSLS